MPFDNNLWFRGLVYFASQLSLSPRGNLRTYIECPIVERCRLEAIVKKVDARRRSRHGRHREPDSTQFTSSVGTGILY